MNNIMDGKLTNEQKIFINYLSAWINKNADKHGDLSRLAKEWGFSRGQISSFKAKRKSPREEFKRREIAEKIGVSYDVIMGIKNDAVTNETELGLEPGETFDMQKTLIHIVEKLAIIEKTVDQVAQECAEIKKNLRTSAMID